jgi:hypothetical protein
MAKTCVNTRSPEADVWPEILKEKNRKRARIRARARPEPITDANGNRIDGRIRVRPIRETRWASKLRQNIKKSCKNRSISWDGTITSEWLRAQFDLQQGRCFYTGIPFEMRIADRKRGMRRPSMDRVDPRGPYSTSNVVLCLTAINYLKNDYDLDEFMALLEDIRNA